MKRVRDTRHRTPRHDPLQHHLDSRDDDLGGTSGTATKVVKLADTSAWIEYLCGTRPDSTLRHFSIASTSSGTLFYKTISVSSHRIDFPFV